MEPTRVRWQRRSTEKGVKRKAVGKQETENGLDEGWTQVEEQRKETEHI